MIFLTYPKDAIPDLSRYICLSLDAPVLTQEEAHLGLFLIDGTWRLAEKMFRQLPKTPICRSLPATRTAYPRRQEDPRGLSSVEALFLSYTILGRNTDGLLDHYHWKECFLR